VEHWTGVRGSSPAAGGRQLDLEHVVRRLSMRSSSAMGPTGVPTTVRSRTDSIWAGIGDLDSDVVEMTRQDRRGAEARLVRPTRKHSRATWPEALGADEVI